MSVGAMGNGASGYLRVRLARALGGYANGFVLVLSDIAAFVVAAWCSFQMASALSSGISGGAFVLWDKALVDRIPIVVPVLVGVMAWLHGRGRYSRRQPFWDETRDLAIACLIGVVAEGFGQYALKEHVSRIWIVANWTALAFVAVAFRSWMKASLSALGVRDIAVLIVGDATEVGEAIKAESSFGWRIVGAMPFCESERVLAEVRAKRARHVVVVGVPGSGVTELVRTLSTMRISYALCLPVNGSGLASMRATAMVGRDFLLLTERPGLGAPFARTVKRTCDILLAATGLVAAIPFAIPVLVAVCLDGGAPLFGHRRVGRNGREFLCLKFRSMAKDADARLSELLERDPAARAEWDATRKLRADPRVTRLGAFIRTTGLDEIPQLWNILRGDMSFVGPRPVTPEELPLYGEDRHAYLDVRPGLTGLWQASGRNDVSYVRRVALDAWYVRNWSPWLDLVILCKTVPAVLARRGAY